MTRLPVVSGEEAIRAFERAAGFEVGSTAATVTLTKPGATVVLTVPLPRKLGPGLLRSLIRKAALTVDDFSRLALRRLSVASTLVSLLVSVNLDLCAEGHSCAHEGPDLDVARGCRLEL